MVVVMRTRSVQRPGTPDSNANGLSHPLLRGLFITAALAEALRFMSSAYLSDAGTKELKKFKCGEKVERDTWKS